MIRSYVVAYDIADDKRRMRIADLLLGYGDRIQYSVFLVQCRPPKIVRLKQDLAKHADFKVDSVMICDLGPGKPPIDALGRARDITPQIIIM